MFNCPNRAGRKKFESGDDYMVAFDWHHSSCTCFIMDLHYFQMLEQDDHVRAYWEAEGRLIVSWNISYGVTLRYPKWREFGNDIHNIGYPY